MFVHANFAAHWDGRVLSFGLGSSCQADLTRVHTLRETYPAIAVGRRTFEKDHPRLTVRAEHLGREPLCQPARFVLTRREGLRLADNVGVIHCPAGDLRRGLRAVEDRGFKGLLLEAGPALLHAALAQDVLTACSVYVRTDYSGALENLRDLIPTLPASYTALPIGEGHLFTFDLLKRRQTPGTWEWTPLKTNFGAARLLTFVDNILGLTHGALIYGEISGKTPPLVRIHSECWTSALFNSQHCDCEQQLADAHRRIAAEGRGIIFVQDAEGRGIGRLNKTAAYRLQQTAGLSSDEANRVLGLPDDVREYFSQAHVLRLLGVDRIRLLTNNPLKADALSQCGIGVDVAPLVGFCHPVNEPYLEYKVAIGHNPRVLEGKTPVHCESVGEQNLKTYGEKIHGKI